MDGEPIVLFLNGFDASSMSEGRGPSMHRILGIDHIAFAAADLEATCAFYDRLFGARIHLDYAPDGKSLVRQIALGGALLSIHQAGNGLALVARHPTVGGADICLRWSGNIETAMDLLRTHAIPIIDGRSRRRTADGLPALSIYFRDPDGDLLALMAADGASVG
jgi:catechol 2,3-dioxygenase-like lactoylglutathione lyase family enzyme